MKEKERQRTLAAGKVLRRESKAFFAGEKKTNAEKSHCVTAEAVAAALFPLMGEYFEGKSCLAGKKIRYCFVNGENCERFAISVRKA